MELTSVAIADLEEELSRYCRAVDDLLSVDKIVLASTF